MNNKEISQSEQFLSYLQEKDQAYQDAKKSGDEAKVKKLREDLVHFLIEEEDLSIANMGMFSEEIQNLILESEDLNFKLHNKPDYKERN